MLAVSQLVVLTIADCSSVLSKCLDKTNLEAFVCSSTSGGAITG